MALVLAAFVALVAATPALAQTVGTAAQGKGSITVKNAAKGEQYGYVKIFGATVSSDVTNGSGIAYTGDIPETLANYFVKDANTGNITKKDGVADADLISAVQAYAATQNPTKVTSDGSELVFAGLDYGYYAVISTQGTVVTLDSTTPNVTVNDKNTKTVTAVKKVNGKDEDSATIGETVTYTAEFDTANYLDESVTVTEGEGDDATSTTTTTNYQVKSYTISDTLPAFLSDVRITSLKIVQDATNKTDYPDVDLSESYTAFTEGKIVIPWVNEDGTASLYKNGSKIQITYTAKITSSANIDGEGNTNTVTITPNKDRVGDEPWNENWHDDAVVKTYGTALKKVDGTDQTKTLKGAKFQVPGLQVAAVEGEPGVYKVVSYDSTSTAAGTEMTVNDSGMLYIIGIADDITLSATETVAPDGYNKANAAISLPAQVLSKTIYETSGERWYDAKGNITSETATGAQKSTVQKNYTELNAQAVPVVNNKGTELPSTGGMGTRILYTVGGIMLVGGAVALISKKRVANMEK